MSAHFERYARCDRATHAFVPLRSGWLRSGGGTLPIGKAFNGHEPGRTTNDGAPPR
jgi:hypothetical protein